MNNPPPPGFTIASHYFLVDYENVFKFWISSTLGFENCEIRVEVSQFGLVSASDFSTFYVSIHFIISSGSKLNGDYDAIFNVSIRPTISSENGFFEKIVNF